FAHAGERRLEVAADIVRQCLQWRDVDDLRLVAESARQPLPHQPVDRRQKGGERLARPGGGRDQHVPAGLDRRPRLSLRRGRCGEAAIEPGGDGGVKQRGWGHGYGVDVANGNVVTAWLKTSRAAVYRGLSVARTLFRAGSKALSSRAHLLINAMEI